MENFKECTVKSVMNGVKGFGKACIDEAQTLDDIMQRSDKKINLHADNTYVMEYSVKCVIRFIDLLNTLSQGKSLPKKILYNDIVYTNVSRTKMNLLYYCLEEDYPYGYNSSFELENLRMFKQAMFIRKSGETDIDILNRKIGVLEW